MTYYARIDPNNGAPDVRDFASPPSLAKGWKLLTIDAQPVPSASQVVVQNAITFTATTATQTWSLRAKTQAELDAEATAAEKATLKAALALFDARTATNAQVQRAIAWLIRQQQ